MITLDDLEAYAMRGWRMFPVFKVRDGRCVCRDGAACDAPGKHPMTYNGVNAATIDPMQIGQWFYRYPGCNWAVATGEMSGIWVLDIDTHSHNGVTNMMDWLIANGLSVPQTFAVSTGGGGWHYYFRMDGPMKNRTGVLPGVDVRGTGGYVLLPGSNHLSGNDYRVAREHPVAYAPQRLTDFLRTAGSTGGRGGGGARHRGGVKPLAHYLANGFTPGNRDNECYNLACSLWRTHFNDPDFVEAAIADCWRATFQGDSPFPWSQASRKITEAFKFISKQMEAENAFLLTMGGSR